jgi:hypothetical protein
MWLKNYLLGRAGSVTAWIGVIGFVLELGLHIGHTSLIMLFLYGLLVGLPEEQIRAVFADWTKKIKDIDKP